MYFCANDFEVGVNDRAFSGNEQQRVYWTRGTIQFNLMNSERCTQKQWSSLAEISIFDAIPPIVSAI